MHTRYSIQHENFKVKVPPCRPVFHSKLARFPSQMPHIVYRADLSRDCSLNNREYRLRDLSRRLIGEAPARQASRDPRRIENNYRTVARSSFVPPPPAPSSRLITYPRSTPRHFFKWPKFIYSPIINVNEIQRRTL